MKKVITSFFNVRSSPVVWLSLIGIFYLLPFLLYPGFNLIDDGWSLFVAQDMRSDISIQNWGEYLIESDAGRFRPFYYVYFFLLSSIFGESALVFWMGHCVVLIATMTLVFKITSLYSKSTVVGMIAAISMLLFPATAQNFYRLGPAEPRQFLAILGFVYWTILQKNKVLSVKQGLIGLSIFVFALGSKETSLILLPWFICVYFFKTIHTMWNWKSYAPFLITIVLIGILFYSLIPNSGYSNNYQSTAALIKHHLFIVRSHEPFIGILGVTVCISFLLHQIFSLLRYGISETIKKAHPYIFLGLLLLFSTLITLPWSYQFERYYYPSYVLLAMFVSLHIFTVLSNMIENYKKKQYQLLFLSLLLIISGFEISKLTLFRHFDLDPMLQFRALSDSMRDNFNTYQLSNPIIEYVYNETPENSTVFVAHNDYEVIYEIGLFASQFGKRSVTIVSENQQLVDDFSDKFKYLQVVSDLSTAFEATSGSKIMLIRGKQIDEHSNKQILAAQPKSYFIEPINDDLLWFTYKD